MRRRPLLWPVLQLFVLTMVVLTAAAVVDRWHAGAATDLAADRGAGAAVPLHRPTVQHAAPLRVRIPRLHVQSRLVDLHRRADGTLQTPKTAELAGWYVGSAHPGDRGPTVLVGHVDSVHGPGVFHDLRRLKRGDVIVIDRSDGTRVQFIVQKVQRVPKHRFPTTAVYTGRTPSLRLVTCGGVFDRHSRHYRDNIIVYATLASGAPRPSTRAMTRAKTSR